MNNSVALAPPETFQLLVESVRDYANLMLDPARPGANWNQGAQRIKGFAPRRSSG